MIHSEISYCPDSAPLAGFSHCWDKITQKAELELEAEVFYSIK